MHSIIYIFIYIIFILENLTSGDGDSGRVPRTIDCELTSDLIGTCVPGDQVTVCGLVKVATQDQGINRIQIDLMVSCCRIV